MISCHYSPLVCALIGGVSGCLVSQYPDAPQSRSCTCQGCFWLPAPTSFPLVIFPFLPAAFLTARMAKHEGPEGLGAQEEPQGASSPRSMLHTSPASPKTGCADVHCVLCLVWEPSAGMPRVFFGWKLGRGTKGPTLLPWSTLTTLWSPRAAADWSRVGCSLCECCACGLCLQKRDLRCNESAHH